MLCLLLFYILHIRIAVAVVVVAIVAANTNIHCCHLCLLPVVVFHLLLCRLAVAGNSLTIVVVVVVVLVLFCLPSIVCDWLWLSLCHTHVVQC